MTLRVRVLGCSGGAAPGRNPSCYLLEDGIAVDAGALASELTIEEQQHVSHVFLTRDEALIGTLRRSVELVTGLTPQLSTSGGTSDARFIKDYCPVVEFGLVGKTIHAVDERASLADLDTLTEIYGAFMDDWYGRG